MQLCMINLYFMHNHILIINYIFVCIIQNKNIYKYKSIYLKLNLSLN